MITGRRRLPALQSHVAFGARRFGGLMSSLLCVLLRIEFNVCPPIAREPEVLRASRTPVVIVRQRHFSG